MKISSRLLKYNSSAHESYRPIHLVIQELASILSSLHRTQDLKVDQDLLTSLTDCLSLTITRLEKAHEDLTSEALPGNFEAVRAFINNENCQLLMNEDSLATVALDDSHSMSTTSDTEPAVQPQVLSTTQGAMVTYNCSDGLVTDRHNPSNLNDTLEVSGLIETIGAYSHFGAYKEEYEIPQKASKSEAPTFVLKLYDDHLNEFRRLLELSSSFADSNLCYNPLNGLNVWCSLVERAVKRYERKFGQPCPRHKKVKATAMMSIYFIDKVATLFSPDASTSAFLGVLAELHKLFLPESFVNIIEAQLLKLITSCLYVDFKNLEVTDWTI